MSQSVKIKINIRLTYGSQMRHRSVKKDENVVLYCIGVYLYS